MGDVIGNGVDFIELVGWLLGIALMVVEEVVGAADTDTVGEVVDVDDDKDEFEEGDVKEMVEAEADDRLDEVDE